jgi:hypothetical protein
MKRRVQPDRTTVGVDECPLLRVQTFHQARNRSCRHEKGRRLCMLLGQGSARWIEEMHTRKLGRVLMMAALVTACGDKPNPVGPHSAPASAVASLVISGADYVLTGSTTAYTATATLSDGSMRTVTPSWSSSAVNVATVDNAGRLDGRAHGSTTLTAAHDGRSASKTVQVVNNYGGSWSGATSSERARIRASSQTASSEAAMPMCRGVRRSSVRSASSHSPSSRLARQPE